MPPDERPYKRARLRGGLNSLSLATSRPYANVCSWFDYRSLEEFIILEVGPEDDPKRFLVHKDVLYEATAELRAEEGHGEKGPGEPNDIIKLPMDEPDVIRVMIYWMYHNVLCISRDKIEASRALSKPSTPDLETAWGLLLNLYLTAEKYKILRLKNNVVDALCSIFEKSVTPMNVVHVAFNKFPAESRLRLLLIKMLRWNCTTERIKEIKEAITKDVLYELVSEMLLFPDPNRDCRTCKRNEKKDNPSKNVCERFHEHGAERADGDVCQERKRFIDEEGNMYGGEKA